MEIITHFILPKSKIKVALFDFDGTLSTLRHGWESIMEPMMLEMIAGPTPVNKPLIKEVKEYINQSTGIQTIYQMEWLMEAIKRYRRNPDVRNDPWWYKAEYNRRLMGPVEDRKNSIITGKKVREDYHIKGSENLLKELRNRDVQIYVASGTDHADVVKEAKALGLDEYFCEIAGAPEGVADCSKEAVIRRILSEYKLEGPELIVIGDGKVEIRLGREVNARTLGVASDEENGSGVNPIKRERLIKAGADAITGDFQDLDSIMNWLC